MPTPTLAAIATTRPSESAASAAASGAPTGRLLFSAVTPTGTSGSLFVLNVAGSSAPTRLGVGDEPDWSPDRTQIAFFRDDGIWIMHADGTKAKSIRHDATLTDQWPVWSPDGSQIAFIEVPRCAPCGIGMSFDVKVMHADGSAVRTIAAAGSPDRPTWSPDGQTIVFSGGQSDPATSANGLQAIRIDGTGQHQFTSGADSSPRWSVDGRFAFLHGGRTTEDGVNLYDLVIGNQDGSGLQPVSLPLPFVGGPITWSPDGAWIALTGTRSKTIDATTQWDLWIVRPDGSDILNLTNSTVLQEGFAAWG